MLTIIRPANHPGAIERALEILHGGSLVAFPTDTVYGVGGLAFNAAAIDEIFQVKDRSTEKAIPILIGSIDQLPLVSGEINDLARRLAARFWPGPLTLVIPSSPRLPANLSPSQTVGVRMPDHPLALALLQQAGPLAATSANLSGGPNTLTAQEVFAQLNERIPLILDGGRTPGGQPSTVVDFTGVEPIILRPGPISLEELLSVIS
jgi:L-threonylcarbamoyladenylate synthase